VHVSSGSKGRTADQESPCELPLDPDDLAAVTFEPEAIGRVAQLLPLEKKPSEEILEGFDGERLSPARGGCGLMRRG
jgi:hypothetical protein